MFTLKGKTGLALLTATALAIIYWPFRCHHRNTSRVYASPVDRRQKYIVCQDCGKEFEYDWINMRIVKEIRLIQRKVTRLQNARVIADRRS